MTTHIAKFIAAIDAGQGIALDADSARALWQEIRDNDLALIYADYQHKILWKDECARLEEELKRLKSAGPISGR